MKKIYIFLLSFMLLFGTSANAFAARKGSSHRSSTSYKSARPKTIRVRSHTRKDGTFVQSHYRSTLTKRVKTSKTGTKKYKNNKTSEYYQ
jgi:hypothetical protein